MPELILEVGCEEIPADDLFLLPEELKKRAAAGFESNRLEFSNMETHATPRRLLLRSTIERMQKDLREQRVGPPRKAAYDASGNLTRAAIGFAQNAGVSPENLTIVKTEKGEYLAADLLVAGKPAAEILVAFLPELIASLPFKKYMKWGEGNFLFGRPIRNLLALYDGDVLPVEIAGVRAGRHTFGHRFLGLEKIEISDFAGYKKKLLENGVVLEFRERAEIISRQLKEQAALSNGVLREDEELLALMANETEFPEVLTGEFSTEFLRLPQEILINAMRKHQKYFCALDSEGHLLPLFFSVLNTRAEKADLIRSGHERVLRARLSDAAFFWNEDRKKSLVSRLPDLSRVTYHEKLGSYTDKMERMQAISSEMLRSIRREELQSEIMQAIELSKVDLVTLMVGEFPELQGIIGGLYAKEEGYPDRIWKAIYDHYLPLAAEDDVPRNLHGALLSLADRIDTLCSGFVLNMIPTGSRDPYALRRVATGAVRILIDHQIDLSLSRVFDFGLSLHHAKTKLSHKAMLQGLLELMEARFRYLMEQKGISYDYLNAILNVERDSPLTAYRKANALWAKKDSPDVNTLARAFKRINNIISGQPDHLLDPELFLLDGEQRLYRVFNDIEFRVEQLIEERQYSDALDIMVTLAPEIDNFFNEVLVMTDDERIRNNRIALLKKISDLYRSIADFSALQIEI